MSSPDMDAPVTRRELYETLHTWGGAWKAELLAEIDQRLERVSRDTITQVGALIQASEDRRLREIAAATGGVTDDFERRLVAVDDQYKDLPARVSRVEAKVFAPKRKRR